MADSQPTDEELNHALTTAKEGVDGLISLNAVVNAMPKCSSQSNCEAGRIHGKICPLKWGACGWQSLTGEVRKLA